MSLIGTLAVNVVANLTALEAGLNKARSQTSQFSKDIDKLGSGGGGFASMAASAAGMGTALMAAHETWQGIEQSIAASAEKAETLLFVLDNGEKRSKLDKMKEDAQELAKILGKDVLQAAAAVNQEFERAQRQRDAEGIKKAAGQDTSLSGGLFRWAKSRGVDSNIFMDMLNAADRGIGGGLGIQRADMSKEIAAAEEKERKAKEAANRVKEQEDATKKAAAEKKRIDDEGKQMLKEQERLLDEITRKYTEQQREADAIAKALRTPLEIYDEQLKKLTELKDAGRLSADFYARAVQKAAEEKNGTAKAMANRADTTSKILGSQEAFAAIARAQNSAMFGDKADIDKDIEKNTGAAADELKGHTRILEDIKAKEPITFKVVRL